jgi:hypothetical protein
MFLPSPFSCDLFVECSVTVAVVRKSNVVS